MDTRTQPAALAELLVAASDAPLAWPGWQLLRQRAHAVTAALAADGRLAGHLVVAPDDPPAVIARVLAHAVRNVAASANEHPETRASGAA